MDSSFPADTGSSIDAKRRNNGECPRLGSAKNAEKLTGKEWSDLRGVMSKGKTDEYLYSGI